jgi:hypothetical protein
MISSISVRTTVISDENVGDLEAFAGGLSGRPGGDVGRSDDCLPG